MKALTSLRGLSRLELTELIESALLYAGDAEGKEAHGGLLSGRAVAMMFFEPSTRTRLSFELATRRLGADLMTFDPDNASTTKGGVSKRHGTDGHSNGCRHPRGQAF